MTLVLNVKQASQGNIATCCNTIIIITEQTSG